MVVDMEEVDAWKLVTQELVANQSIGNPCNELKLLLVSFIIPHQDGG